MTTMDTKTNTKTNTLFEITVSLGWCSKKRMFQVRSTDTILDLKKQLENWYGISVSDIHYRLIHKQRELDDAKTFSFYNILPDDGLYWVRMRLSPSPAPPPTSTTFGIRLNKEQTAAFKKIQPGDKLTITVTTSDQSIDELEFAADKLVVDEKKN